MLNQLVKELGGSCALEGVGPLVGGVQLDSRQVQKGDLFVALPGDVFDGRHYISQAVENGASAVLVQEPLDYKALDVSIPEVDRLPEWVHPNARAVAGKAAALVQRQPAKGMHVIAITGTNGKTTTAHITAELLAACDFTPAVIGTTGHRLAGGLAGATTHTTPDAATLQKLLRQHRDQGGDCVVLEASSHALVQERLSGLEVTCAIFTNLSHDHLDYHGDMQQYAQAKSRLFAGLNENAVAILNADDPYTAVMRDAALDRGARVITYSSQSPADLCASLVRADLDSLYLTLSGMGFSPERLRMNLLGQFNLENALAASAAVLMSGASPSAIAEGLATVSLPPGRLERVSAEDRGFHVFVDYAHSEDALRKALTALRGAMGEGSGRLHVVFGCGGERDASKREPMGRAASELADSVVLTSDNPRGEDPDAIIREIRAGILGGATVFVESDRRLAISSALGAARPGDVVLIAGKGHETQQVLATESLDFDDRVVAVEEMP